MAADPAPIDDSGRPPEVPVRPAATVILVRDTERGVEVFVMERTAAAVFAAGAYVFPGGRVDVADGGPELDQFCDGIDDRSASQQLGLERGGLAFWVAAIRECFEEAGILLARRRDGAPFEVPDVDRERVHDGSLSMADLCRRDDLVLETAALRYVSHWVTPRGEPRRFDTRFFLGVAPDGQHGSHDDAELVSSRWVRPADALAEYDAGELMLLPPTLVNLRALDGCGDVAEVLRRADEAGPPQRIEPTPVFDGDRFVGVILPDGTRYQLEL